MPGSRRGLVAPQNTFLESIVRKCSGARKYYWHIFIQIDLFDWRTTSSDRRQRNPISRCSSSEYFFRIDLFKSRNNFPIHTTRKNGKWVFHREIQTNMYILSSWLLCLEKSWSKYLQLEIPRTRFPTERTKRFLDEDDDEIACVRWDIIAKRNRCAGNRMLFALQMASIKCTSTKIITDGYILENSFFI